MNNQTSEAGPGERRAAFDARDWPRAYGLLSEADARGELAAEELELLSEASRWTRRYPEMMEALQGAGEAYEREGRPLDAGLVAVKLTIEHYQRAERAQATGCLLRATELIGDAGDSRALGLSLFCRAELLLSEGQWEEAEAKAVEMGEMARRLGDRDLEALALMARGRARHQAGGYSEGAAMMDQAAAGAVAGDLELWTSGVVLCANISACRMRWDVRTASEWSDAAVSWCKRHSVGYFPGLCRLHMGESLNLRGEYEAAVVEVDAAIEDLRAAMPRFAADGIHELGEIRRRQGELEEAERLFAESQDAGGDGLPGLIRLRLDQGKAGVALALARDRLDDPLGGTPLGGGRAQVLPDAVHAAAEAGDPQLARMWLDELTKVADACDTTALRAAEETAAGRVALDAGDPEGAVGHLRASRRLWAEAEAPYDAAIARGLLARARLAVGEADSAAVDAEAALAGMRKIGARLEAERAQAFLDGLRGGSRRADATMLFTDIVGSTRLVEALGDDAWESLLAWHDRTLLSCISEAGGKVLKHEGDGFFVTFTDPDAALACAIAIQRRLSSHQAEHGYAPSVRIGVHADQVTDRGGDVSGLGVHLAARVMAAAGAGEILASDQTIKSASDTYEVLSRESLDAKGVAEPVPVARVGWN